MSKPLYWTGAALALLICAGTLKWHWQPERQVRRHQAALFHAYEKRDWADLHHLVAEEYKDGWGQNKADLMQGSQEAFRHFLFLTIEAPPATCQVAAEGLATVETTVRLRGRGSPVAEVIMDRVRALKQPFRFTWQKAGAWPWDWVLIHAEQPELNLDRVQGW